MNTQSEALQILQHMADEWQEDWDGKRIRNELFRLHEVNQELLEALKKAKWMLERDYIDDQKMAIIEAVDATIAKAQGESK